VGTARKCGRLKGRIHEIQNLSKTNFVTSNQYRPECCFTADIIRWRSGWERGRGLGVEVAEQRVKKKMRVGKRKSEDELEGVECNFKRRGGGGWRA
jgi:hypothetical protein